MAVHEQGGSLINCTNTEVEYLKHREREESQRRIPAIRRFKNN